MLKIPTDRQILEKIYMNHSDEFCAFTRENKIRSSKIYIPIDFVELAKAMKTDPDIIFGRLYYYLNNKFGYENSDGTKVHLFTLMVGNDKNAVNFPLLTSVLATLRNEDRKHHWSLIFSVLATVLATISALVSYIGLP